MGGSPGLLPARAGSIAFRKASLASASSSGVALKNPGSVTLMGSASKQTEHCLRPIPTGISYWWGWPVCSTGMSSGSRIPGSSQ